MWLVPALLSSRQLWQTPSDRSYHHLIGWLLTQLQCSLWCTFTAACTSGWATRKVCRMLLLLPFPASVIDQSYLSLCCCGWRYTNPLPTTAQVVPVNTKLLVCFAACPAAVCHAAAVCASWCRVASQFSSLQALWLEHCTLPCNFVAACLPAAAPHLESLGLLHVHGTCPAELASTLSGLSGLTSLRLIPADHGLGGLGQLVALKHLKKLNIR